MASSSTLSIPKSFTYDVFLSFRGEDTRKNFVDHLYHALQQKSINTFKDDKNLEKGERISTELIKAIEDSRFHIIVFSKNYASSSWCLDELVKILECQKMTEHTAYPVFYDVEPTEVRKQTGAVGEAFFKHRNEVDAGKWREALKEAAGLSGWELKNFADGHEFPFIQTIVEEISQKLPFINSSVDENLVGMETRVDDIVSSLETSTVDDILMIGIKGIGGGGKTTLARAVFDQISSRFEGKSFVENVREVSKSSLSGLKSLQEQVLRDVLNNQGIIVSGVHDGKMKMKNMISGRKVLLVLDDVDHIDQLEALAGKNWFGPGSRLIITTRDAQVLIAHEVNSIRDVNLLSNEEAICLFNKFAFRTGEIPIPRFKLELSQQVVRYAAGLPLTIRVLGADLKDKDEGEWKDTIERLKKIPLQETLKKLELSYISLDEEQKNIFLDVACFWKGEWKGKAIRALESCELHAIAGLRVLERKSLITISERLDMHDHIQEMGRNIVRRSHPDEPYRHSRLWIAEEILDILANDLGSEETRGIKLSWSWRHPSVIMKGLNNMKKLQFLHVTTQRDWEDYPFSNDGSHIQFFPNTLQYLYWNDYPFSSLQGGEGKVLKKLKFLYIDSSSCLKTLDLGFTPNLETLRIRDCDSLKKLHMSTVCEGGEGKVLKKLRFLHISRSPRFKTLDLGFTPNLETLSIENCNSLQQGNLWEGGEEKVLKKLRFLYIGYSSSLKTLDLGFTPNLETLTIRGCPSFKKLHMPTVCEGGERKDNVWEGGEEKVLKKPSFLCISFSSCFKTVDPSSSSSSITTSEGNLWEGGERKVLKKLRFLYIYGSSSLNTLDLGFTPNLETLSIRNCLYFNDFHMPPECLKLKSLDIFYSNLTTLDLGFTPNLETLSLERCDHLVELQMPAKCLKLKSFEVKGSTLTTLDLKGASNLEMLSLKYCFCFVELQMPTKCLKLVSLKIWSYLKLTTLDLGGALNLETLSLEGCDHLVELQMPAECLKLKSFVVRGLALTTLNLRWAPNLEELRLEKCDPLVELQMPAKCLKLKSFEVKGSTLTTLDLEGCSNLETLALYECHHLVELQMPAKCLKLKSFEVKFSTLTTLDLEGCSNLETLTLYECHHLVELQMPAKCLKLVFLTIWGCFKLTFLDLRGAPNLEKLSLDECHHLVELHMPAKCLKLKSFIVWGQSALTTLDLEGTSNLEELILEGCFHLVELHMPAQCLKLNYLRITRSKLTTLNLQGTPNLEAVCLEHCDHLLELHMPVEFRKLEFLKICRSKLRTLDLGGTPNLKELCLVDCVDLVELDINIKGSKLRTLDLGGTLNLKELCLVDCVDLVKLDINIKGSKLMTLDLSRLENLKILSLSGCYDLVELKMHGEGRKLRSLNLSDSNSRFMTCLFKKILLSSPRIYGAPDNLYRLQCLEELTLSSLDIKYLPNGICILKHLKSLKLEFCRLLEKITEDLGRLECLEKLILSECGILQDIPDSICKMKRLQYISLRNCFLIGKLPEELGQLECLEELNIEGTCISNLPQSIIVLKHGRLRIVGSRPLLQSCGFTSEIRTSEEETFCYV